MKGVVVAGTRSGVGKTVATLAVSTALEDAGYSVQPGKAGPDYIDPSHHAAAFDRPSRTLDTWMQGVEGLRRNYWRGEGDVCVIEGVMGLYDGDVSSTAQVAAALDLPVVLVVDASAGMESVAATALGFREYATRVQNDGTPAIDVVGIIAQQAHGGRHETGIREALPAEMEYFGRIAPNDDLAIPDRHLGLHMGEEAPLSDGALADAAAHVDAERIAAIAREPPRPEHAESEARTEIDGTRRIAVARDEAFRFVYPATVERFDEHATVEPFSPVAGDPVPDADAIYLPGGYPELHAADLAESNTLTELADLAADGLPTLGECGGMMALCRSLRTAEGETFQMAGVLPATLEMHDRYQALDHVEVRASERSNLADRGATFRGHEFHYSTATVDGDARFAFDVERGDGIDGEHDGLVEYRTVGTYTHFHPASGAFDRLLLG